MSALLFIFLTQKVYFRKGPKVQKAIVKVFSLNDVMEKIGMMVVMEADKSTSSISWPGEQTNRSIKV